MLIRFMILWIHRVVNPFWSVWPIALLPPIHHLYGISTGVEPLSVGLTFTVCRLLLSDSSDVATPATSSDSDSFGCLSP